MKQYLFALAALLLLLGCAGQSPPSLLKAAIGNSAPEVSMSVPSDFGFAYSFGPFEANKYDSRNGAFSRDTSCVSSGAEKQKEFALPLAPSEKEAIYRAMVENGLFSVKEDLRSCPPTENCPTVSTPSGATLAFMANGRARTISWESSYPTDDADYQRFARVAGKIDEILGKKRQAADANNICFYQ